VILSSDIHTTVQWWFSILSSYPLLTWYVTVVSPRWFPVFIRVWGHWSAPLTLYLGDGQSVFHTAHLCNGPDRDIHPDNSVLSRPNSYHAFLGTCGSSIICNLVWLWNSNLIVHSVCVNSKTGGKVALWLSDKLSLSYHVEEFWAFASLSPPGWL
jgi:hypothetical protein